MKISQKIIDPHTIEARISLGKEELVTHLKRAAKDISGHVTVDGFRKGKAPEDLVQKQIDPAIVRQEALELALSDSFTKATIQEKWDVMRTTELKVARNDAEGLEYSVRVQLWPVFTLPELTNIKVPRQAIMVSAGDIAESLDTVRNMRATFLDKTGPAATGDRVEADFDALIDGKPVQGGQSRNHPLIIGGKSFMPGFEEALVGLSAGGRKEFSLTAPQDYYEPALAGRKIDFTVTVNRVQAVLKPEADDAFAKSLGKFENLDQLNDGLREGIMNEKQTKERQRIRLAILDTIIAKTDVPAPEMMVHEELDGMVQRFARDLESRGSELSMYLARLKKSQEDLRKDWTKEAARQVRIMLILRQVAKEKNIAVSPNELDGAVKEAIGELMQRGQLADDQVDPERVRTALGERILTDKTLDYLEKVCAGEVA